MRQGNIYKITYVLIVTLLAQNAQLLETQAVPIALLDTISLTQCVLHAMLNAQPAHLIPFVNLVRMAITWMDRLAQLVLLDASHVLIKLRAQLARQPITWMALASSVLLDNSFSTMPVPPARHLARLVSLLQLNACLALTRTITTPQRIRVLPVRAHAALAHHNLHARPARAAITFIVQIALACLATVLAKHAQVLETLPAYPAKLNIIWIHPFAKPAFHLASLAQAVLLA